LFRHAFLALIVLLLAVSLRGYTITYIEQRADYTEIQIDLQDITITEDGDFAQVALPKGMTRTEAGSADLPYILLNYAVPEGCELEVSVTEGEKAVTTISKPMLPVGRPNKDDSLISEYIIDEQKYRQQPSLFNIIPKQSINQYDYVSVEINPLHYSHSQNRLEYPELLTVKATIRGNFNKSVSPPMPPKYDLYTDLFVNKRYAPAFQIKRIQQYHTSNFARSQVWYKMEVWADGMYVLDRSNLPPEVVSNADPREIRLFSTGGAMMFPDFLENSLLSEELPHFDHLGHIFQEVPIHLEGGEGGNFTNQTKLYFYATQRDGVGKNSPLGDYLSEGVSEVIGRLSRLGDHVAINPYSKQGVYWLTWGRQEDFGSPPKRMGLQTLTSESRQQNTGRQITHKEENVGLVGNFNTQSDENLNLNWWYMRELWSATTESITFADVDTSATQSFSFVSMYFLGSGPREITPSINNIQLDLAYVKNYLTRSPYYKGKFLHNGANTFTFTPATGSSRNLLKSFTIEWKKHLVKRNTEVLSFQPDTLDINENVRYTITNAGNQPVTVYQVDNFYTVQRVAYQNLSFIANGNSTTTFYVCADNNYMQPTAITRANIDILDQTPPPHDVLIIYPDEFASSIERLTSLYELQGYTAHSARLESVFNNFSGGHPDPVAIRNYLHYIQLNTPEDQPKPLGAVFIGSGTIDERNFSGIATSKNKFILNQVGKGPRSSPYITSITSDDYFANFTTYRYPEIITGRIPVKNTAEFSVYMDKMKAYIENKQPGWWQYTAQLIADDFVYQNLENNIEHSTQINTIGNNIKNYILVDKLFAQEYPLNPLKRKPNVKNLLIDKLNEGRLFWVYFGHGSIRNCGDEQYFNADEDLPVLRNKDKYPIFIAGSCNVGQFDLPNRVSLAEELIFRRDAGSIISIGATRKSHGPNNLSLFNEFLQNSVTMEIATNDSTAIVDQQNIIGSALIKAKAKNYTIYSANAYYNILGDPFLKIAYPSITDSLHFTNHLFPRLNKRESVAASGEFKQSIPEGIASIRAYDNGKSFTLYTNPPTSFLNLNKENLPIFNGSSAINNSEYNLKFIVPDDAQAGSSGKIVALAVDQNDKTYVDRKINIAILNTLAEVENNDEPKIELYLNSRDFKDGDEVGQSATLIADIYDENGLNTIGNPGRNVMIRVSSSTEVIAASSAFEYDIDSYQRGTLTWPLTNLTVGNHTIEVVAYDSFNRPAVAKLSCIVRETVPLVIKNALVYPNPIKRDGDFTFELDLLRNDSANVTIEIYTITGRKIRTISGVGKPGFNQIHWDGRDADGDNIANNTYFYKIKANSQIGKSTSEITDKFIKLR